MKLENCHIIKFPHKRLDSRLLWGNFIGKGEKRNWTALHHPGQNCSYVAVDAEGAVCNDMGDRGLLQVDADIAGIWILQGVPPEWILDNGGSVVPHTKLQIQDPFPFVLVQVLLIAAVGLIPSVILHKGLIAAQIHRHGTAADRAVGNERCGDPHVFLLRNHLPYFIFVAVGLGVTRCDALPEAVISLGLKQPVRMEACELKLMVHICGENEVVSFFDKLQQLCVDRFGRALVTVEQDMPAPPCPILFLGLIRIKSSGVHIPDAVPVLKVFEMPQEAFTGICQPSGCGQAGPSANDDSVRLIKRLLKL